MKKIKIFCICAMIVTSSLFVLGSPVNGSGPVNTLTYIVSGPIRINGDGEFNQTNGVTNWATGDGSAGNPWIIENWEINGTGNGNCIYIGNTTEHFIVRDCFVYGAEGAGGWYRWNSGIVLYNVQNGSVTHNEVSANSRGIYVRESSGNIVSQNNATANILIGIFITESDGNEINENNASFATNMNPASEYGIYLDASNNNTVNGNNASYNENGTGVWLWKSYNNTITNNVVWGNEQAGIMVYGGSNNVIGNDACYNLNDGISLTGDNNTIAENILIENYRGIEISNAANTIIENNNVSLNTNGGINMDYVSNTTISHNIIFKNYWTGIMLRSSSHNNTVTNNTISNSEWWGLRLILDVATRDNRVYCNNFIDNLYQQADDNGLNFWNATYPIGGNYWNDYSGVDANNGPNQDIAGADGFIDVPRTIDGTAGAQDFYPRVTPLDFTPPTIAGTVPVDGATDVGTGAGTYAIEFSEVMDTSISPAGNIVTNLPGIIWAWDGTGIWLNGTYTSLITSTTYYVNLTTNFIDMMGYVLEGDNEKEFITMPPDTTSPTSSVDQITTYWQGSLTADITAIASDTESDVANVTLRYRYSDDNSTWGSWTVFGIDTAQPWSWTFDFLDGEGYYEFFSVAADTLNNTEAAPATADTVCAYDVTAPQITDESTDSGTTGDEYLFQAVVSDNLSLSAVHVIYWFGSGSETNITMTNVNNNDWEASITIPLNSLDSLEYYLAAVDSAGNWKTLSSSTATVLDNDITVADAGADQNVVRDSIVIFDGSGSTDNIEITNYTWTFTFNALVTIYDVSPTFNFTIPGNYTVTLTVMDAAGNSDTDTMLVTVTEPLAPIDTNSPTANAGADQNVDVGTLVTFNAAGSTDNEGIVNYTWAFTYNGTATTLYGVSPTFRFWSVGDYTVTLEVMDAAGNNDDDIVAIGVSASDGDDEPDDNDEEDDNTLCMIGMVIGIIVLLVAILIGYKMMKGKKAAREEPQQPVQENEIVQDE